MCHRYPRSRIGLTLSPWLRRLILGLLTGLGSLPALATGPVCLEIGEQLPISASLPWLIDVRWGEGHELYLAASRRGAVRIDLKQPDKAPVVLIEMGNGPHQFFNTQYLALSADRVVVGAPAFVVGSALKKGGPLEATVFEAALDLDAQGDRVLVLGVRRDEQHRYAPEGAIAWQGSLSKKLGDWQPAAFAAAGPGVSSVDLCHPLDVGVVRYLPDGGFLLVPGVEEGVFRFDAQGKLVRSWTNAQVGADGGCDLPEREAHRLHVDVPGRRAWVNRRRAVDDILPLADNPVLIVRSVNNGKATWELKTLAPDGVKTCALPLEDPTGLARIKADVRGDEVVLLVAAAMVTGRESAPAAPHRLLRARVKR